VFRLQESHDDYNRDNDDNCDNDNYYDDDSRDEPANVVCQKQFHNIEHEYDTIRYDTIRYCVIR